VNSDASSNQSPASALVIRRVAKARKPLQRDRHLSPIDKNDAHGILSKGNVHGERLYLNS